MHAISSYRANRLTHIQTGPITIQCSTKLSAQCNELVDFVSMGHSAPEAMPMVHQQQ